MRWAEAEAFMHDELCLTKVIGASDQQWSGKCDDTVSEAVNAVLRASGEWDVYEEDFELEPTTRSSSH